MITEYVGSLLDSAAQVWVNPVNLQGVMGRGLASTFKLVSPQYFNAYRAACLDGTFRSGDLHIWWDGEFGILSFPTKVHWRDAGSLSLIESGLARFQADYARMGIESVAFPRLGCGLGRLDWATQVRPLMWRYLANLPIPVEVWALAG